MRALPVLPIERADARPGPRSVRLSLTDRCDLACIYCRPDKRDGYLDERLDVPAWTTMVRGLVASGVRRVRITGGEPLLHPDVVAMIRMLGTLGLDDLALTTNATRLEKLAKPLREAGLQRLNVSLDTLDPARFRRMTRGGNLAAVLRGIDAAMDAGFSEIKLNTVVVRGENDDELEAIVDWSWRRNVLPRFLEIMAIGEGAKLGDRLVTVREMRGVLAHRLEDASPARDPDRGPAAYVRARGAAHRVGFISGASDTYCEGCDRLRVASDGVLRPCLATNDGRSAAQASREGDARGVTQAVRDAWSMKPDGATWKGCTEASAAHVSIRAIGG